MIVFRYVKRISQNFMCVAIFELSCKTKTVSKSKYDKKVTVLYLQGQFITTGKAAVA